MFDARKTGMIGLYRTVEKYGDMLSRFHTIPAYHSRTDRRTELVYQYRASRDKQELSYRKQIARQLHKH